MTESPIAVTSRPRTRGGLRPAVPDGGAGGWEVPGTVAPGIATRGRADRGTGCPDDGTGCPDDGVGCPDDGTGCPDDGVGCPDDGVGWADGGSDRLDGEVGSADGDVPAGPLAAFEAPGRAAPGRAAPGRAVPPAAAGLFPDSCDLAAVRLAALIFAPAASCCCSVGPEGE